MIAKLVKLVFVTVASIVFCIPLSAQATEVLSGSIVLDEPSIEIFFPAGWIVDTKPTKHYLYESDFDRTSGQQPRSMVVEITWFQKIPGETLEQAFEFLAGDATLIPTAVEDTQFDMLRADTTMVGNVPLEVIVIDAADHWAVLNIMKPTAEIVDAMLTQITLAGLGDLECSVWVDVIDTHGNVVVSIQARNGVAIDPLVLDMTTLTVNQDTESTTYAGATLQVMSDGCDEAMSNSSLYDVVMSEVGNKKINVIRAVRTLTGLGLAEAKDLVEMSPNVIVLSGVSLEDAEAAKVAMEAEGATIILNEQP